MNSQHITPAVTTKGLTPRQVHKIIQGLNAYSQGYNDAIPLLQVAALLHVNTEELARHIDTLKDLYYIKFSDRTREKVLLTLTGKCTVVPYD